MHHYTSLNISAKWHQNFREEYVEIKCQLVATEVFIADLIACSTWFGHHYAHHQELKCTIQWLLFVIFRTVVFKLLVWFHTMCLVCRMLQHPANTTSSYHCIVLLSSWWRAQWCSKHVEQAIRSAIKASVASIWHFISTYLPRCRVKITS